MDEIIKHLDALYKLTSKPKYALDIADLLMDSPFSVHKDQGLDILFNLGNTKDIADLPNTKQDNYIKSKIKDKLQTTKFTLWNYPQSLSVIIPTLWKADEDYLRTILFILEDNENVLEVIIHDNNPKDKFPFNWSNYRKVRFIEDENRYVNPAWNKGVSEAKGLFYLLLNDDCLINHKVIKSGISVLQDREVGLVVFDTKDVGIEDYYNASMTMNGNEGKYCNHLGWCNNFWCVFGRTDYYEPIPEDLKVFYGDNWLREKTKQKGKKTVQVITHWVSHKTSSTVNAIGAYQQGLLQSEGEIYRKVINQ